ncbi:MAG TPA: FIST N-terminal domain-containing protein, partial [Gemmatimonadaceae bacterium]|nr:FIST N-terminal domain-containing protein [Gemmatimonadaceae bacterium]
HILFAEDSLALVLLSGDNFHAVSGVARSVSTDVAGSIRTSVNEAVERLAGTGDNGGAPRLCITMPDGLTVSGSAALDALRAALGDAVPIFGGTAGDQWRFKGTKQFHGTEVLQDSVPFLLFDEGVVFSFGVDTGWRPIGREGRVTEVEGHIVRAIDGKPATAFYREFLGNADITQLTEYPLAVTAEDGRGGADSYYLRAPGRTDEATGCIHFLGDVPDGARVHITTTNRDQILDATRTSFQHALDDFPKDSGDAGKPALALCISCAGRKQILGSRTQEEARIVNELLGDVPAAGFYGYGEIARLAKDGISHYHNETFTTLLLGGRGGSA